MHEIAIAQHNEKAVFFTILGEKMKACARNISSQIPLARIESFHPNGLLTVRRRNGLTYRHLISLEDLQMDSYCDVPRLRVI